MADLYSLNFDEAYNLDPGLEFVPEFREPTTDRPNDQGTYSHYSKYNDPNYPNFACDAANNTYVRSPYDINPTRNRLDDVRARLRAGGSWDVEDFDDKEKIDRVQDNEIHSLVNKLTVQNCVIIFIIVILVANLFITMIIVSKLTKAERQPMRHSII
jgi:hypothetical protein